MKKLLLFFLLAVFTVGLFAQTGTGWDQVRRKQNFKDSSNLVHAPLGKVAWQEYDYIIEEFGGRVKAHPNPHDASLAVYSDTNLTSVLRNCLAELTTGGNVYIKAGLYDHMDTIVVPYAKIKIEGAGMYKTILKLKSNADVGKTNTSGFIQLRNGVNDCKITNLKLDGNWAKQTKFSDGNVSEPNGILRGIATYHVERVIVENVYVTGFTLLGIYGHSNKYGRVTNCRVDSVGWNGIMAQMFGTYDADFMVIEGCLVEHCGDVGINVQSPNVIVRNNIVKNIVSFPYGSGNTYNAISLEGHHFNISVLNNQINVATAGIQAAAHMPGSGVNALISGNNIDSCTTGINWGSDSSMITNNMVTNSSGTGILLSGADYNFVSTNVVRSNNLASSLISVLLTGATYSDYNVISNNYLFGDNNPRAIIIGASGTGNVVIGNTGIGKSGDSYIVSNTGTNTLVANNANILNTSLNAEIGAKICRVTVSGAGTQMEMGSQFVRVYSNTSADEIAFLPLAADLYKGTKIEGYVTGTYGFELRVEATQAASVYLNGVTTNVEARIPANSSFEVIQIDATHWILKAWTNLGAEIAAIVPDAV